MLMYLSVTEDKVHVYKEECWWPFINLEIKLTELNRFGKGTQEWFAETVTCWVIIILTETKVGTLTGKLKLKLCYVIVDMCTH